MRSSRPLLSDFSSDQLWYELISHCAGSFFCRSLCVRVSVGVYVGEGERERERGRERARAPITHPSHQSALRFTLREVADGNAMGNQTAL